MFQSFETPSHDQGGARLALLREELARRGLHGFIVPRADAFQGENVPPGDERLRWLTGFTGSAGSCIVLEARAAVFVDGRYTLQARDQLDGDAYAVVPVEDVKPSDWLREHAGSGAQIGYDPWLLTTDQAEHFRRAGKAGGFTLEPVSENPIDAIWPDQSPPPAGAVRVHPEKYAGKASREKREEAARTLTDESLNAFVLTAPDSVNWLLNIRGTDVPHTPVVLAYAILHSDGRLSLFLDEDRAESPLLAHLGDDVQLHPPSDFVSHLAALSEKRVGVERASAPAAIGQALRKAGADIVWCADPCTFPKARKNATEQAGARSAHLRDGAAVTRFLCWFDRKSPKGKVAEVKAAKRIERYRGDTGMLDDISFDTISAFGAHAALPHYRVSRESNLTIHPGSVYLVDSGGQYPDGTTDITRTVAVGTPTAEMRRAFTLVLKGMIAVSVARFPPGTTGVQIDALARAALWQGGLDFNHGTGHGVGSFLGVHEGPASLSKRGTIALEPGMILSNEPGYYREGAFGIRIENLLMVREAEVPDGGELAMLSFETLTLAPIDLRLVDASLLRADEIDWLDGYHARVYDALYPLFDDSTRDWLELATCRIAEFVGPESGAASDAPR